MHRAVSASLALFVCLAAGVLTASPVAALGFTNLYVFGDSLVDSGNTQALVVGGGGSDPAPASAGYFDGRFTNGITPADVMNQAIEGGLIDNSLAGGDNFAFGGARARNDGGIPDLEAQVAQFGAAVGGVADPDALYMINVGGNDIFDALTIAGGGGDPTPVLQDAAAAIAQSVLTLRGFGASRILFVGVGDVGSPPSANGFEAIGRAFSIQLNGLIEAALHPSVRFFDTIGLFDQVLLDPTAFGLPVGLESEISCLSGGGADPAGPPTCDAYTFFDNTHPTTQVLQVLGNELVAFVPEPGTGLLVAFGLVVLAARRLRA